jgi:hypothetical protein
MAITDFDDFVTRLSASPQFLSINITPTSLVTARFHDLWTISSPVGVAPTTSVVPTNTTTGSLEQVNGGSGALTIMSANFRLRNPGTFILADRLVHSGGLSGTSTSAQTTNLPTTALTRYTSGQGVMIGLSIYSQIGSSTTSVSASYTNQAGTSGRTTPSVEFGGTGFREANRLILLPLQAGDTGVRAVASVTVAANTGSAGNFGVVLFRPLAAIVVGDAANVQGADFMNGSLLGGFPEIVDDACLFCIMHSISTSSAAAGVLTLSEL